MTIEIQDNLFESEVLKADKPVLVDFYSPSCGPCKVVDKELKDAEKELGDTVKIVKINVFHAPSTSAMFSIMSVPTVMSFKNGRITGHLTGSRKRADYVNLVK